MREAPEALPVPPQDLPQVDGIREESGRTMERRVPVYRVFVAVQHHASFDAHSVLL
jgi:hypothetical protein